jgi:hypothetical protein
LLCLFMDFKMEAAYSLWKDDTTLRLRKSGSSM